MEERSTGLKNGGRKNCSQIPKFYMSEFISTARFQFQSEKKRMSLCYTKILHVQVPFDGPNRFQFQSEKEEDESVLYINSKILHVRVHLDGPKRFLFQSETGLRCTHIPKSCMSKSTSKARVQFQSEKEEDESAIHKF